MNEPPKSTYKKGSFLFIFVLPFIALIGYVLFVCYKSNSASLETYNQAVALMESGEYDDAIKIFKSLEGYKDSESRILQAQALKDATIEILLPSVISKKDLDNYLSKMESEDATRFKYYYKLYDISNATLKSDIDSMSGRYPILERESIYLLRESVPEDEQKLMEQSLIAAGYTTKDYWNDYSLDKQKR